MNSSKRNETRQQDELLRCMEVEHHTTQSEKECFQTGYQLKKFHVAQRLMPLEDEHTQSACNLFLCKYREQFGVSVKPEDMNDAMLLRGVRAFQNLPPSKQSIYLRAAVVDNQSADEPIASNAFHNFLALHVKISRAQGEIYDDDVTVHKARSLWKALTPESRLPFFMQAYLATFYPWDLDASIMYGYEDLPTVDVANFSLTIKQGEIRTGKKSKIAKNNRKKLRFNLNKNKNYWN